eukprot:g14116.t1
MRSDAIRCDQMRSDAIRCDQMRSDQIRSGQVRSGQIRSDLVRSDQIRSDLSRSEQSSAVQNRAEQIRAHHNIATQTKANKWLVSFQTTLPAWTAAARILKDPQLGHEAHFYAANVLRTKLQFHFDELPDVQRGPFRDSLLGTVVQFNAGLQAIRTRLALCVGALFVQTAGSESWKTALPDITAAFGKQDLAISLLDMLTVIPEECREMQTDVSDLQRRRAVQQCKDYSIKLMSILNALMRSAGTNRILQKKVFECFAAWIKMDMIDPALLCRDSLFQSSFKALEVVELFPVACIVLAETFRSTDDFRRYTDLVTQLVPKVLALKPLFQKCSESKNILACKQLGNVFIEMGESYLHFVLEFSDIAAQTVNLILMLTAHQDKDISSNTFHFWYRLAKVVSKLGDDKPQQAADCRTKLSPFFLKVLLHLHTVMKYPLDYETWDQDTKDKSKRYREEAGDVLRDCATILGPQRCLQEIFKGLQREITQLKQTWPKDWHGTEASLYCVRMIARQVLDMKPPESLVLPHIMKVLPQFARHVQLQYTSTLIVGRYAEWLKDHPDLLSPLFPFVIQGFSKPEILPSSSRSFIFICESCAQYLAKSKLKALFKLYQETPNLGMKYQLQFIEGFCAVISVLPVETFVNVLRACFTPLMAEISSFLTGQGASGRKLDACLDRLAEFFRCLAPKRGPDPDRMFAALAQLTQGMMSTLLALFDKYHSDDDVVEGLVRVFKYAIRTMKEHFLGLLTPVFAKLIPLFESKPHFSFLYLLKICCEEYVEKQGNPKVAKPLFDILVKFSSRTTQVLDSPASINKNPEFVEDYFNLIEQFLHDMPDAVLCGMQGQVIGQAWQCAHRSLREQHFQASRKVMQFYAALIGLAITRPARNGQAGKKPKDLHVSAVMRLLQQSGQMLMQGLMQGIMGELPKSHNEYIIKVIITVLEAVVPPLDSRSWIAQTVMQAKHIDDKEKQKFLQTFREADRDWGKIQDALWKLSDLCHKKLH